MNKRVKPLRTKKGAKKSAARKVAVKKANISRNAATGKIFNKLPDSKKYPPPPKK